VLTVTDHGRFFEFLEFVEAPAGARKAEAG
jgi:hypothetical protein